MIQVCIDPVCDHTCWGVDQTHADCFSRLCGPQLRQATTRDIESGDIESGSTRFHRALLPLTISSGHFWLIREILDGATSVFAQSHSDNGVSGIQLQFQSCLRIALPVRLSPKLSACAIRLFVPFLLLSSHSPSPRRALSFTFVWFRSLLGCSSMRAAQGSEVSKLRTRRISKAAIMVFSVTRLWQLLRLAWKSNQTQEIQCSLAYITCF